MTEMPRDAMLDELGRWLLDQGNQDVSAEDILKGYCERLAGAGIELHRAALGGMMLHPNFGAMSVVWSPADGVTEVDLVGRDQLATPEFQNAPFYRMLTHRGSFMGFRLDEVDGGEWFPLFDRLKAEGVTEYLVFKEPPGDAGRALWAEAPEASEGVLLSLCTCRAGGFGAEGIANIRALAPAFALAVKAATARRFTEELLRTYIGPFSGREVLDGAIERGAGREIDCVLFYCDLRDSTRLAEEMALDDYLAMLNGYFDCTAGAVVEHGGEVLKFIGDAVMAIFPIDAADRTAAAMRRAAIAAAREALARRDRLRAAGAQLDFGVALHSGKVKYGNVGTEQRLDFTVIGPPVNLVTRLEGLCKTLGVPVVASADFAGAESDAMRALGAHPLAGVAEPVEVYALP